MLTNPGPPQPAAQGPGRLSARERELVALVARGRTDAQIAAQLYISFRTVRSHLDRIRDKTGCRHRALIPHPEKLKVGGSASSGSPARGVKSALIQPVAPAAASS
jgi:DNA-binding CsgD family transcriptional regulator